MNIHIVQKGDTLWSISKKYGVDFEEVKRLNSQLASPDMIMPGMKIKIPATSKIVAHEKKTKEKSVKSMPLKPLNELKEDDKHKATEFKVEKPKLTIPKPMPVIEDIVEEKKEKKKHPVEKKKLESNIKQPEQIQPMQEMGAAVPIAMIPVFMPNYYPYCWPVPYQHQQMHGCHCAACNTAPVHDWYNPCFDYWQMMPQEPIPQRTVEQNETAPKQKQTEVEQAERVDNSLQNISAIPMPPHHLVLPEVNHFIPQEYPVDNNK